MAIEEDDFMQMLLDGLDHSKQSPGKHPEPPSKKNHADDDLSMLLDGAENWDWADMEADFMTPKKKTASPNKVNHLFSIQVQPDTKQRPPHKRQQSPVTPRRTCSMPSSTAQKQDANLSISALLEGAETWDWGDMENDFLTPPRKRDKLKVQSYCLALFPF